MRVVAALERHTAAGRLSLDEFSERAARAHAAATCHELALVTGDLPAEQSSAAQSKQLLVAFGLAVLALVVLALILAVAR
jgi:hypothetical protein